MANKYDWNSMKSTLQEGLENKKTDWNDPREWKLQRDDNENGTALIRLLPGKSGTTPPIIRLFEHSARVFNKASNKYRYYIEPSPSTIKQDCPISDLWYELGGYGTDEAKELQKTLSRRTVFISNILVVNDPDNPDNNGKVFYWKYGVKLFEKFQAALEPTPNQIKVGKKPVQLFDPMEGANIMLVSKKLAGFVNYDDTTIEAPSKAFNTEKESDEVVEDDCLDLTEFTSPEYFKSYTDLLGKLKWTLSASPIEKMSLLKGSKIITDAYVEKGANQSTRAETPTPRPTPTPAKEVEVSVPEPTPSVAVEDTAEVPKTRAKTTPKKDKTDQAVLDMIENL